VYRNIIASYYHIRPILSSEKSPPEADETGRHTATTNPTITKINDFFITLPPKK
jgi:hypothetical protein